MRTAIVSLIAFAGLSPLAYAQTAGQPAAPVTSTSAPAPAAASAVPAATPAAGPAAAAGPQAAPAGATAAAAAPEAAPAPPPAPPPPPPAPTDPTAIAVLNTLENVCIPSAAGGDMASLAKANGFRKSGDNFTSKGQGYQLTIQSNAFNRNQCHVDIVHPVDPEGPGKPIVVALHNWSAVLRGWDLYRNDKNVASGMELTTRSWEHTANGKHEALVLFTTRKPDGTPMKGSFDTSTMLYSLTIGN